MDIRHLKYFIAIAEEGKITAAAKRLHMAQPPLSRQLKQMEEELGVLLFERNRKKSLMLTAEGEVFLKRAKEIVARFEESIAELRELGETVSGTLAVGSTIYCASLLLQKIMVLREQNPELTFKVWEGTDDHLHDFLESRQIEVAITANPFSGNRFAYQPLRVDPCVLVLPKQWSVPHQKEIAMAEITQFPLILLRPTHGKGMYDQIVREFHRLDLQVNILCECLDTAILLSLVSAGLGATILPQSMLSLDFLGDGFKMLHIKGHPLTLKPVVIWRANGYLSKPAREFLNLFYDDIQPNWSRS